MALVLNSHYPMFVAWGPGLAFLYNDGYAPIFGQKHPHTLGQPFKQVWAEIWDDIAPLVDATLAGDATYRENMHFVMERRGFPEDTWYNFSYSPVRDDAGQVAGIFCACVETTGAVRIERRRAALLELDGRLRDRSDTAELSFAASELLGDALGAVRVGYGVFDPVTDTITVERDWSAPGYASVAGLHHFRDYGAYAADLRRGEPVAVTDVAVDPRTAGKSDAFAAIGIRAFLDVPVTERGRTAAMLFVHSATPRHWTTGEVAFVRDFAERARSAIARRVAEAEQRESAARLSAALAITGLGTFDLDLRTNAATLDERARAIFGLAVGEGMSVEDMFALTDTRDLLDVRAKMLDPQANPKPLQVTYRVRLPDGTARIVSSLHNTIASTDGAAARLIGVFEDVTDRHRGETGRLALMALSDAVRDNDDPVALAASAAEILGRALQVSRAGYGWVDHEAGLVHIDRDWAAPGTDPLSGTFSLRQYGSFIEDLQRGGMVVVGDTRGDARVAAGAFQADCVRSFINVPVIENGRLAALLFVGDAAARNWHHDDVELVRQFAERTRAAVERIRYAVDLRALNADLERKVTERALARGRTWQLNPDLLGVINARGFFESFNPAWLDTLGWSEEELASRPFMDFVHPADAAPTWAVWERAIGHGVPALRFENRYRHKYGGWRWLSWVAVPDEGKVYCSARDVTADKERDAALAQRTAERDRTWRLSQDLLVIVEPDGRLVSVNEAWTPTLGWTQAELVGITFMELTHPDDLSGALLAFADALVTPLTDPYAFRLRHRNDGYRWLAWTAKFEDGRLFANGRDVTAERERQAELEAAQAQLRQSQKMEAVGQLTGGLAHDFNNLLGGISGSLDLIRMRLAQGRTAEIEKYVTAAQGAANRAASLTHRLLAFSRRQTLAPKPTDIKQLVAGMEDLIGRTIGPDIRLETVNAAGLWPSLIDPSQLENAVLNLCINARDAMAEGGKITVETANRWLDQRAAKERGVEPGQYISLCVTDTGTGMTPDVIAKAFDPFFTTKPIGVGTGLGLSMIYGFAKQSGGAVNIYSEPGQGTTVCIYLPRHLGSADEVESSADLAAATRSAEGETVLVVDDEPTVRMLVSEVLGDLGYNAIEAEDGAAGLRVLNAAGRIDLLVTDVGLPGGMNGRQVADAARAMRPGLKVLFITGYAENAVLSHGHLDPGMHVMTKPFAMDALASRIQALIRG